MVPSEYLPFVSITLTLFLVVGIFMYWWTKHMREGMEGKEQEVKRRLYELAILKEISDRTGYSLNIKKILDVISGSLNQFLEYSAVSYMLIEPSKIVFKIDLDRSVSPQFIKDMRARMLSSLSALLGRDFANTQIEEIVTGALMLEALSEPIESYFNIPLVIGDELVGVLTIASTKAGLYKEAEMEILYKIINQASQAVTKLEEVVKTEQGKIAAMLESMIEGVVMTDRDYRVIAANPAAKAIIGFTREGVPTIFDFIDILKNTFDIKGKLEEAIKLDKVIKGEEILLGDKYYQVLVTPVKTNTGVAKGEILGGAVIFHDMTHEKEAEKMRSDFTSMMVHELRSPLGNIKKIGEMLSTSNVLDNKEERKEYISMLYESSSSMLSLVNDLLDVARLEAGKFEVDKHPFDIKEIILERVKFFSATAQDKGVLLHYEFVKETPTSILLDTKRISQVVDNLVSNALKYTPKGGTVTIRCAPYLQDGVTHEGVTTGVLWSKKDTISETIPMLDNSLIVSVSDTGEGIAPENTRKLWNKFTQFESSVRQQNHEGTGLGLVIVKGIVESHGGMVGVRSASGKGSTFYFTLPLA
jgi:signal transduction histidine kinase